MASKKLHILIFSLLLAILSVLQSCEKKPLKTPKRQNNTVQIDCLLSVAHKHFEKGKFDSSYYYFDKAKNEAIIKKDTSRIIHSFSFMAESELNQGEYSASETTTIGAFPFLKNTKKYPYGIWNIYNVFGINYLFQFDYKNALIYHTKASKLNVDLYTKNKSLNNIAYVYMEKQDYLKAIQILLPLTFQKKDVFDSTEFARIIENLGYCYFKIKDSRAFNYLNKALIINTKNKFEWGLITSYSRLAEFYMKNNPSLAYKYSHLAYDKATKINDINDRLISLTSLIKSSEGNQSKKHALDYIRISDSNNKVKQMAKNQFAKMKYDSKQDRDENQKLKIEKTKNEIQLEQQKNRILMLFYLVTTGIITTLFVVNFLNSKNKREKIKTTIETENRISKKIHDEVANDIFSTINFAETHDLSTNKNKEILISNLDSIYSVTRNISRENNAILKGIKFEDELKDLLSEFNTSTTNVLVNGLEKIDWIALENIKKIIVYRVLQELLINMKKHSKCCLAMFVFKKNENNLEINYSDNGAGAPIDKIIHGNGLQNVRNRILDIKGNITFETEPNKGFKTSITLPL